MGNVTEIEGESVALEKSLQQLIDRHLSTFFGVRFLGSEHATGRTHGGRIDTLGIDENGSPVIIEYKRSTNENVINQGLFYLDWLMDHRAEFEMLVIEKLGAKAVEKDKAKDSERPSQNAALIKLDKAEPEFRDLYHALSAFLVSVGDDVTRTDRKFYVAYRRLKNFCCVEIHAASKELLVFLKVDPTTVELKAGFSRDVREVGHFGTGELELRGCERIVPTAAFGRNA